MTPIRIAPAAEVELAAAATFYRDRDVTLADDLLARVADAFEAIAEQPRRFGLLETNRTGREVRRCRLRRFPYLVVFEMIDEVPHVLSVIHTSRHPDAWQS